MCFVCTMQEHSNGQQARSTRQHSRKAGLRWLSWLLSLTQRVDEESWTCYVLFVLVFVLDVSLLTMLFPVSLAGYALLTQRPSALYWQVSALHAFNHATILLLGPTETCDKSETGNAMLVCSHSAFCVQAQYVCCMLALCNICRLNKDVVFLMLLPLITSLPSSPKLVIPCVTLQACLVYLEGILIAQYLFQIPAHLHCRAVSRSTEVHRCHHSQLAFAAAVLAVRCCQIFLPIVSRSPAQSACKHYEQGQC